MDDDIVSTSRQHLEKFIRELHSLANCVKILYSSLYPSIVLENNLAPNTQIGRLIIEDPDDPNKNFGLYEHHDMYSNDDDEVKYTRGGEFLENMMSGNILEFCRRWLMLGDIHQVLEDLREYYKYNKYEGKPVDYSIKDCVYFTKSNAISPIQYLPDDYGQSQFVTFEYSLSKEREEELKREIEKEALL